MHSQAYIQYVQASTPQLASIHLLCKQQLVGLYEKAGFSLLGPSPVVHGQVSKRLSHLLHMGPLLLITNV